jgi:SagB-type dehydrogenase family enzyme
VLKSLSAEVLSVSTLNDPQFLIPEYPSLVPGVLTAWLKDGLLVEGTTSRRMLKGLSVRNILPAMFPLLDGSRDWGALAESLALSEEQVREVLSVLFSVGLLEEGPRSELRDPLQYFVDRAVDCTRKNRSGTQARLRLGRSSVFLRAPERMLPAIQDEIELLGVSLADSEVCDLAVLVVEAATAHELSKQAARLRSAGVPILFVGLSSAFLAIGPTSHSDHGACFDCILAELDLQGVPETEFVADLLAPAVAIETTLLLARIGVARTVRNSIIVEPEPLSNHPVFVSPRPGCQQCGAGHEEQLDPPLALRYENAVAFPPQRLTNPRDHQMHFEANSIQLQFEVRKFPGLPRIILDQVTLPLGDTAPGLRLETVGAILATAFGFKRLPGDQQKRARRWAPSGGNLGSPQAYVSINGVAGIQDGLYAYGAFEHSLVFISSGRGDEPAGIELYVVSEFDRVWKKYGTFSYRVVALDAGVVLTHLALMSTHLGLHITNLTTWDEEAVALMFGIDLSAQAVTAHVLIGERP